MINFYRDLIVWQKSIELTIEIYSITTKFPKDELYGLTSQMKRSSVSIASNIAEGKNRSTKKDYVNFLRIAFGSGAELETQIEIVKRIGFVDKSTFTQCDLLLNEIMKMLNAMIIKLTPKS